MDLLVGRGWERGGTWAKMMRPAGPAVDAAADLRIERVGEDRATDFGRVLIEGMEMPPIMNAWAARQATSPGYTDYGAFKEGELVGEGVLFVRDGVAQLVGAATLLDYRGRGAQLAPMAKRIKTAAELGAAWVTAETDSVTPENPNPSLHNMYRADMTMLYHRRNWLLRR
jgi:hypothetical protein